MRALFGRVGLAVLIGLVAAAPPAKAGGVLLPPRATVAPAPAGFHPLCAPGSHYACWYQPYGSRFCGCWLADRPACPTGYFFACGQAPNGPPACGCY